MVMIDLVVQATVNEMLKAVVVQAQGESTDGYSMSPIMIKIRAVKDL